MSSIRSRPMHSLEYEWILDQRAYTSYTFECSSGSETVWKELEGVTEKELGRAPTAAGRLCTIMVKEDDGFDWEVCGRSGRAVGARLGSGTGG